MVEPLSNSWPSQLDKLLERLRQDGFRIGVPEILRLQQLLLALVDRGVSIDTPQRLASLLGPVLCRSASEQEAFGRHVEEWWPGLVVVAEASEEESPAAALEEALAGVERRRRRVLRWLPITPLALGVTAAIVAAAVGGVLGGVGLVQRRWSSAPQWIATPRPDPPRLRLLPQAPPTPTTGQASQRTPGPTPQPRPSPRQPKPVPPPATPPPEPPIERARDSGLFLLPSEIAMLTLFAALLSLVAVQGTVRLWWWRQARLVLERLPLQGEPQLHRIALAAIVPDLVALPQLHRIGRALNRWRQLPSSDLDGAATVEASLRLRGWLSPRYGLRWERLREEGVLAEWACFRRDPFFCQGPAGHGPLRSLADLAAQHPEAVVVVVADGERFFSPVDGSLEPWLDDLGAWSRRVALTLRPVARWGALEAELERHVKVLPASAEGLLALGQWLEGAPPLPLEEAHEQDSAPEPPLLRGSAAPWLDARPPLVRSWGNCWSSCGPFWAARAFSGWRPAPCFRSCTGRSPPTWASACATTTASHC